MKFRIKDGIDLEELRKYGFKTGKEWADAGEKCLSNLGYAYQHVWWHKFYMDPSKDNECIYYADDDFDQPMVQITIRTESRDLWIDCTPSCTYHISGEELDIVVETIMRLTEDGLLEMTE